MPVVNCYCRLPGGCVKCRTASVTVRITEYYISQAGASTPTVQSYSFVCNHRCCPCGSSSSSSSSSSSKSKSSSSSRSVSSSSKSQSSSSSGSSSSSSSRSSSSSSSAARISTPCCGSGSIPATIYMTFATGFCSCMIGPTFQLNYDPTTLQWISSNISCGSESPRIRFFCNLLFTPLQCSSFDIRIDCFRFGSYEEVLVLETAPNSCSCDPFLITYGFLMWGTQVAGCGDCSISPNSCTITG